jgi:hypothetical protein
LLAPVQTGLRKGKKVQAPKRHDNLWTDKLVL